MNELQELMNDISEWSDKTFGDGQRNPAIAYHLKKEVDELIDALEYSHAHGVYEFDSDHFIEHDIEYGIKVKFELADCMMLLLDSASHYGISAYHLLNAMRGKLEINKNRKWGKPDENGVVEHLEE